MRHPSTEEAPFLNFELDGTSFNSQLQLQNGGLKTLTATVVQNEPKEKEEPILELPYKSQLYSDYKAEDCNNIEEQSESESDVKCIEHVECRKNKRKSLVPLKAVSSTRQSNPRLDCIETSKPSDLASLKEVYLGASNDGALSDEEFISNIYNEEEILKELVAGGKILPLATDEVLLNQMKVDDIFRNLNKAESSKEKVIKEAGNESICKGIKCNMCNQVFALKTEFEKHYSQSYGLYPVYTCIFCDKTLEKYSTFRSHFYRHISEGRYKCNYCCKNFSLRSVLRVHILSKHIHEKPYSCEECAKKFSTKTGLNIHLKRHKLEIKEDYPCIECGKVLHTRGGLTSHMNVHRLGRRFMCDVCGKTFTQKVNMLQHVKQHTGEKPHICEKCGKTFVDKSQLTRHYISHSEQRPLQCTICQKMYKTEHCLKMHQLVHAKARPYVCTLCNKSFLSSTKLKQHNNIHTGERPFKCNHCERDFTNYPNLLKHTRRRHKINPKKDVVLNKCKDNAIRVEPSKEHALTESMKSTKEGSSEQQTFTGPDTLPTTLLDISSSISLSRSEELLLQQGLFNVPDERNVLPSIDILPSPTIAPTNNATNLIMPYFQTTLSQNSILQQSVVNTTLQFSDYLQTQYLQQQTLSCD